MSSAGISFGGLASGLDTQAIISALVAVERRPIQQLETKKTSLGKQKTLFSDLSGLLEKLKTASKALKTTNDFLQMKVSSDDEDILTATATSSASPGSHTVKVIALASAQVHSSNGRPAGANVGTGEFILTVGGQSPVIRVDTPTLEGVAAAINDQAGSFGVRAEVVDTGSTTNGGANRYQLVVRSTETGAEGGYAISSVLGDTPAFDTLMNEVVTNVRTPAQDAHIQLNGAIDVYRSSNSITGAIPGVTLDLKAADVAKTVTLTISTDATETAKKVTELVDAYNKVVDFFAAQNVLGEDGKAKSPLFGDVTLRSIRSSLRTAMGSQVTTSGNTSYQMLSQLGLKSDTQGKLTFTQSKLEEALADDENAVAAVFTDSANGIAGKLETQIEQYTDSVDGLLKTRNDGFDRQTKQMQSRIDQSERRLDLYKKQLEVKYANLESLLSKLQSQGSSVSNIRR